MDAQAAAFLGAGLAMLGTIGAGLGIGILGFGAVQGIARNPEASGNILTNMILGLHLPKQLGFIVLLLLYC